MKNIVAATCCLLGLVACNNTNTTSNATTPALPIQGTWQLITGTLVEKGDTTVTDYTQHLSFIKIINATHFAFLQHDTRKDSSKFSGGGGSYQLLGNTYTEHLEYCQAKEWEGHDFTFTITIHNDTLVQTGIEKIEAAGVNRINTEKYIRVKK
ncbi:MAG: hypothetical protein RL172_1958 [Bacteroidota bacterium]|jgi:hypothetical protein